jgi:hypothetical protein
LQPYRNPEADMLKRLTTSIYTFEKLIDGGYLYVDKTEHIWRLVEPPSGIYFLSRPRRFGKSLTLSTLKAVFEGKRHLFRGLAIDSLPYEWKTHPVIHLDMGESSVSSAKELSEVLSRMLENVASEHGLELAPAMVSLRFSELIRTLSKKNGVVILVDEYDKPILDNIGKSHVEEIRDALSNFYSVIKSTESCQRFVFMTGVSKFSKVSVFSKLNNLTDLTMDAKCATMLGYTQTELEENFSGYLDQVCSAQNVVRPDLLDNLRKWYNGYRFEESAPTVYNPVSVGKFFESGGKFRNYWFETGTPTFLLKLAKKQQFDFEQELSRSVDELAFSSYEIDKLDVLPLLVQTGYLTIHSSETKRMTRYFLGLSPIFSTNIPASPRNGSRSSRPTSPISSKKGGSTTRWKP